MMPHFIEAELRQDPCPAPADPELWEIGEPHGSCQCCNGTEVKFSIDAGSEEDMAYVLADCLDTFTLTNTTTPELEAILEQARDGLIDWMINNYADMAERRAEEQMWRRGCG